MNWYQKSTDRNHKKFPNKTFVEFARDKESLFDKWCVASKVTTMEGMRELVLRF